MRTFNFVGNCLVFGRARVSFILVVGREGVECRGAVTHGGSVSKVERSRRLVHFAFSHCCSLLILTILFLIKAIIIN